MQTERRLTVTLGKTSSVTDEQEVNFKVTRDQEILGVLLQDNNHCWQQIEGAMDQDSVDAIGKAIDSHYN